MNHRYSHILSPLRVRNRVLKDRLLGSKCASMLLQGPENYPAEGTIRFYEDMARNGAATVCVSMGSYPDKDGKLPPMSSYDMSKREYVRCNTLLISCGLVPEQELFASARNEPGLFVCGNADKVHDLVDRVCIEGIQTGAAAAHFAGATGKLDCALEAMAQQEIKELPIMQERLDQQKQRGQEEHVQQQKHVTRNE